MNVTFQCIEIRLHSILPWKSSDRVGYSASPAYSGTGERQQVAIVK